LFFYERHKHVKTLIIQRFTTTESLFWRGNVEEDEKRRGGEDERRRGGGGEEERRRG